MLLRGPAQRAAAGWAPYGPPRRLRAAAAAPAAAQPAAAAVGIDLGTTNSVVAVLRPGEAAPTVLVDPAAGGFTVPSVVAYPPGCGGVPLVGAAARAQAAANPLNTFSSVKRLMGRAMAEAEQLGLVYGLEQGEGGGARLACPALGSSLTPQQVSAEVLRYLLELAAGHLGGASPTQVVITVPAYFTAAQRQATLEAAKLAGIEQVSLLAEPVAAAMAFGFGKATEADTLLVFDLGGGTFDLSVVDSFEGIMEVLATAGDPQLGGDDFDTALLAWALQQQRGCVEQQQQQPALPPQAHAALLAAVEAAKCALSSEQQVKLRLPSCGGQQPGQVTLSRQQMHDATAGLRQRLWRPLQSIADDCKLEYECKPCQIEQRLAQQLAHSGQGSPQQQEAAVSCSSSTPSRQAAPVGSVDRFAPAPRKLTAVLLVGGATRMPIIQAGLRALTGLVPRSEVDPEQAVALGAAIQAAVLLGLSSGLELMDGSYVAGQHERATGFA